MSRHHVSRKNRWLVDRYRPIVLERDGYKCRQCGKRGDLEVHHIKPLSRGGSPAPKNCLTLCVDCHIKVHETPVSKGRREWREFMNGI